MRWLLLLALSTTACGPTLTVHRVDHPPVEALSFFGSARHGAPAGAVEVGRIFAKGGFMGERRCREAALEGAEELDAPYVDHVDFTPTMYYADSYHRTDIDDQDRRPTCTATAFAMPLGSEPAPD